MCLLRHVCLLIHVCLLAYACLLGGVHLHMLTTHLTTTSTFTLSAQVSTVVATSKPADMSSLAARDGPGSNWIIRNN